MPREPQQKTINGVLYEVTPLGASKGLQLFTRVARVVGPGLERVTSLEDASGAVLAALGTLAENLDADNLEAICRLLADSTMARVNGKELALGAVFDAHFAGDLGSLFEWLKFGIEVNLGPLLAALGARVRRHVASAP